MIHFKIFLKGPLFNLNEPNERLDANDAVYTEGVRTNVGGSGFLEPFCHSDFYPNGGKLLTSELFELSIILRVQIGEIS